MWIIVLYQDSFFFFHILLYNLKIIKKIYQIIYISLWNLKSSELSKVLFAKCTIKLKLYFQICHMMLDYLKFKIERVNGNGNYEYEWNYEYKYE